MKLSKLVLPGNSRKTGAASGALPEDLRSSYAVWRRASAPFALLGNSRKTGAASGALPKDLRSSYAVWRRASAPFALLTGFLIGLSAFAQTSSPTPGPTPGNAPVFLDNHRPLNPKKEKNPTTRTVTGQVVDDTGQPLEGALVTLVDNKTKEKFEFFTKKDGRYKFEDLSFSVDYQLRAKWKNLTSEERKLSQYDHTARIIRQLEVTTPDGAPPPTSEAKTDKPKS